MRLLTIVCVAVLAVAFCAPAFAETQNIKVDGDVTIYHLLRNELDLAEDDNEASGGNGTDRESFFMQKVGLNIAADLTDNVSTYVRLLNERDWDTPGAASASNEFEIYLDEAYVTFKEFLYAPLTLNVGRQNMWFGKGFIIGNNNNALALPWDHNATTGADELSDQTAFDAIRGTLDYDPWTIDLVWAKIDENNLADYDDIDLYGINAGYIFDQYEAEAEAYLWSEHIDINPGTSDSTRTHTAGVRGSAVPLDQWNVFGELAYQFGTYSSSNRQDDNIEAWATDLCASYNFVDKWLTPVLGTEYVFYSGEESDNTGSWGAWNSMYRGKFETQIREFQNVLYTTDYTAPLGGADTGLKNTAGQNAGNVNQHAVSLFAVIDPMDDIKVDGRLSYFWLDHNLGASNTNEEVGVELDGKLLYDYTEDVTFALAGGIFWPGDLYEDGVDKRASQLVSTVSVDF